MNLIAKGKVQEPATLRALTEKGSAEDEIRPD